MTCGDERSYSSLPICSPAGPKSTKSNRAEVVADSLAQHLCHPLERKREDSYIGVFSRTVGIYAGSGVRTAATCQQTNSSVVSVFSPRSL